MRYFISIILILFLLTSLGCVPNSNPRKGKKIISDFLKSNTVDTNICSLYTRLEEEVCYANCPDGTHVGTDSEINDEIDLLVQNNPDKSDLRNELANIVSLANGICIENAITRPTNQVWIKNNFCGCLNGKAFIMNNCEGFCAAKNDHAPTLYASVDLGTDILLNDKLGNLHNWCKKEIDDGHVAPDCVLELFDGENTWSVQMNIPAGADNFTADLSLLAMDKTYRAQIKEVTSQAKSDYIQLRRMPEENITDQTPLKMTPVSQYTCISRSGVIQDGDNFYENATKLHYFFPSGELPAPLPPENDFLFCHDINIHGSNDGPTIPRLELVPNSYALWNKTDTRFYDANNDGKLDINKEIEDELNDGSTINLFQPMSYNTSPYSGQQLLGYYMQSWIGDNGRPFCPGQTNYDSGIPIFSILKTKVGIDTEAVWIAKREPSDLTSAPDDYIFIRETVLKKIWFYVENGILHPHNDETSMNKTIMFFHPFDENAPLTRKSDQYVYTVFHQENSDSLAPRTKIVAADKRLGCIPKLD